LFLRRVSICDFDRSPSHERPGFVKHAPSALLGESLDSLKELSLSTDVCVLSPEEAGRLEHYGVWPACKAHRHIKRREALLGAESGEYRYLGGEDTKIQGPVSMVVKVRATMWRPVATMMPDGRRLVGLRTWGLASTK